MGKVNKINIHRFRNFETCKILFNNKCNVFFGQNGSGKTNILEAISILAKGRGFRNAKIENLINNKHNNFLIEAEFEHNLNKNHINIYNKIEENKHKKITSVNNEVSKDAKDYLDSSLSYLIFLPEMERLFLTSPAYRRNFIDRLIFTENKKYNSLINKYKNKILERNKILLDFNLDENWINVIESEIATLGLQIYALRNKQINILNENILFLNSINQYPFSISFKTKDEFLLSDLNDEKYVSILKNNRPLDAKIGGSKIGPHKSDFLAIINDEFDAAQLSTGQQKTLVLMTLMAQCNYLTNYKKIIPILLFDEICSHLDSNNRRILLDMIDKLDTQFFLTGTEETLFSFISTNAEFYNITNL